PTPIDLWLPSDPPAISKSIHSRAAAHNRGCTCKAPGQLLATSKPAPALRPRNTLRSSQKDVGPGLLLKRLDSQIREFVPERREALKYILRRRNRVQDIVLRPEPRGNF